MGTLTTSRLQPTHELSTVTGHLFLEGELPTHSGLYMLVAENIYGIANASFMISRS